MCNCMHLRQFRHHHCRLRIPLKALLNSLELSSVLPALRNNHIFKGHQQHHYQLRQCADNR
ncbi:hypothetical protein B0H13DRAFT_2276461 [Mycena leptocephala]|nr:hypothetical protein B0H13DRAFT_2276461 [Mycena leptocephala]